jgi:phosphoribosylformylglycinamidine (FGAM) synthase-like enzyme
VSIKELSMEGTIPAYPQLGGGFVFDESFKGKPLVFCGTGGIIPAEILGEEGHINHIEPGDAVVMVGGRIGKDGIHGATFSSSGLGRGESDLCCPDRGSDHSEKND